LQKPSASNVAGVRAWNSLGRFVRRGEKGILILAPLVDRKVKTVEEITGENGEEKNPQAQLYGSAPCMSSISARLRAKTFPR